MRYDKWFKCCALVAVLFLGYVAAVSAATVGWRFEDVWFEDGTRLEGSFLFDEDAVNMPWCVR